MALHVAMDAEPLCALVHLRGAIARPRSDGHDSGFESEYETALDQDLQRSLNHCLLDTRRQFLLEVLGPPVPGLKLQGGEAILLDRITYHGQHDEKLFANIGQTAK